MNNKPLIIPFDRLSPDVLRGVIEEFITREGTDYGMKDIDLASKFSSVKRELETGLAVLVFDPGTETTTIFPSAGLAVKGLKQK